VRKMSVFPWLLTNKILIFSISIIKLSANERKSLSISKERAQKLIYIPQ